MSVYCKNRPPRHGSLIQVKADKHKPPLPRRRDPMSGLLGPPPAPPGPPEERCWAGAPRDHRRGRPCREAHGAWGVTEGREEPGVSWKEESASRDPFCCCGSPGEGEELTPLGRFLLRGLQLRRSCSLLGFCADRRLPPLPLPSARKPHLPPGSPPGLDPGRPATVWNIPGSPAHAACTRARSAGEVRSHLLTPSEFHGLAQL